MRALGLLESLAISLAISSRRREDRFLFIEIHKFCANFVQIVCLQKQAPVAVEKIKPIHGKLFSYLLSINLAHFQLLNQ